MVSLYDKWKHTKILKIDNPSSTDGVQVDCTITCFPEMDRNFNDIRFTKLDGTNIEYHLKTYTEGVSALVVLRLPSSETKIILYYGNSLAVSASNPHAVYEYYDDFSTDTSAGYTSILSATRIYDGTNKCLKQTNRTGGNHFIVTSAAIYPDRYIFEAKVKITNESENRNHGGLIVDCLTTAYTGNRLTHLDNTFQFVKALNAVETNLSPSTVSDGGIYADDRWLTERVYRDRITGYLKFEAEYNGTVVSQVLANDTTRVTGQCGIHSYNCETWVDEINVRKYVTTVPTITILTDNAPKYENYGFLYKTIDFSADYLRGINPLSVQFTDLSVGTITSWLWNFGDEATSTDQNPLHQYTSVGVYDVSLTVTIDGVDYTETKTRYINVLPAAPVANFSVDVPSGDAYHDVVFTDLSTNTPHTWYWEFGDGQISRSQNPSHRYQHSGTYTVVLTSSNNGGSDKETKVDYITVTIPTAPVADFVADDTDVTIPTTVNFTDLSTNKPTSWLWDFGDGETSVEQNPAHTYDTFSTYGVTLTAMNEGGSDSEIKTGYITVSYYGIECSEKDSTETSYVLPLGSVVETAELNNSEQDNFSGHIHSPTSVVFASDIESTVAHLDQSVWLPNARIFVGVGRNRNIYNTFAVESSAIVRSGRSVIGITDPFYSVYSGADKVALIGKVYFANNQPFPNVEAILYGYTYRQIVETNAYGIFGDYYDPDTYYKLTCISENGIVYDSATIVETGTDVYTIVVSRRTKSNATFRQMHRKFI